MSTPCRGVALMLVALAGCPSETEFTEVKTDPQEVWCGEGGTCDQGVDLSEAVIDCYWDESAEAWLDGTPEAIVEQCEPGAACENVVLAEAQPLIPVNACQGCEESCPGDLDECCYWNEPTPDLDPNEAEAWLSVYFGLKDQIQADCGLIGDDVSVTTCVEGTYDVPEPTCVTCADDTTVTPSPAADRMLRIDPDKSFVGLGIAGQSVTAGVRGSMAIGSKPTRFLRGLFWVDDTHLAGTDYKNWVFSFDVPVPVITSGPLIKLPVKAVKDAMLKGDGWSDKSLLATEVTANHPITGTLDLAKKTWSLNYQQTHFTRSITVHLEGSIDTL